MSGSAMKDWPWKTVVERYQRPSVWRSVFQMMNTIIPYSMLWCLMYFSLRVSWWLTLPLAAMAGAFLVRIFVIFHDCCHGSFFKSQTANHIVGAIMGVLVFTPCRHWSREHAIHHASAGHLDRRGTGDIWTLTVQEYLEASRWKRVGYRLARNPVILFLVAPLFIFLVMQRFPSTKAGNRERRSVYGTNVALLFFGAGMAWLFGLKTYLFLQLGVLAIAAASGVWLFYVQHQFEGVYWDRGADWDYCAAALKGSSFYKLPGILQWFSGNIGFHHIHHLSPRIPNYNLEKCYKAEPLFQAVKPVTFFSSFRSLTFRLWDEQQRKLVGFRVVRNR
jgi:omega-6 fatty acid desaturase (delta-12 desaturase)